MGTDSPSVPVTVADALPNLRTGRLARGDDLTSNRPAKHLIARRRAYRRQHLGSLVRGRLRSRYDPKHRALSRRITGVRTVAGELWELVAHRPVWRVIQSIQVPSSSSGHLRSPGSAQRGGALELDQLVIGPAGVFIIETVYRPVQDVTADAARNAARRTQEILGRATRVPVTVQALIVFVRSDQPRVEGPCDGVEVLTAGELVPWLESRQPMLTDRELEIVHLAARDRRTWAG
ncbi:hypothetical protein APR04_003017 [Promicromonospora umidemergens]|uniref:NERD domain-containing protein n=1 Tax=Promicromonospora umidemergens TaxID=629679 RepID=A0ABP8WGF3_9MICO|nr:hypothetical protein [Promicromonospora umidemergens]MCP2284097.1 hypothetical protein [Promicromonospora umidemergens]